jgi:hypothetical protein
MDTLSPIAKEVKQYIEFAEAPRDYAVRDRDLPNRESNREFQRESIREL